MKHIIFIVFIGIVAFTSCNNRTTKRDSLKQAVSKFKNTVEPIEFVEYFPNGYSEKQTDTILSNGITVRIKSYTDINKGVVLEKTKDSVSVVNEIHRKWISEIKIEKEGILIFSEIIDDAFFKKHMHLDSEKLSNCIVLDTALYTDHYKNTDDYIILHTGLAYLKEKKNLFYDLKIDTEGRLEITDLSNIDETI
ncbi:MAG: hypothetical protein ACON5F_06285 [Jejuia sp.]